MPSLTPEQRLRQSHVKFRIIHARDMRRYFAGELDMLTGDLNRRAALDAIRTAYAAGLRDGAATARPA